MIRSLPALTALLLTGATLSQSLAHEGHTHDHEDPAPGASPNSVAGATTTTGSGDFVFRYRADLSALPEEIAKGIKPAHGGFAKTPTGEIYFGLEGTGLIRLSADLTEMTLVSSEGALVGGGLHNTTYLDQQGGRLILPDNRRAQVIFVDLDGAEVKTLGRPADLPEGPYRPTDTDVASNGKIYVCDGYGKSKLVLTVDAESLEYDSSSFGGPTGKGRTEGKFSTNHGVTFDPADDTLLVADRERKWVQKLSFNGEFIEGVDMAGANPCDVDLVEFGGETLMVVGCLKGPSGSAGVVQIVRDGAVTSTLRPKDDLGLELFRHIHNAAGVVVDGKLFVLCYGWNPGCYAVLEHVAE